MPTVLTPTATVHDRGDTVRVEVTWTSSDGPLDRPSVGGYGFAATKTGRGTARRLAQAINEGVWYPRPELAVDVNGATYVSARGLTIAKYANSELRKLGY